MRSQIAIAMLLVAAVIISDASNAADSAPKTTAVSIRTAQTRLQRPVLSFYELRQNRLVRQSWDTSCGAAALSTLLTYHVGLPVTEYAVATLILRGADPSRVRQRGGFSLLDLKRFVEAVGLVGDGYGAMQLADLATKNEPAIVPIRLRELDHFVVYRGQVGDRVLLGDPAFGNITMAVREFETVWRSRIAFYVHTKTAANSPNVKGLHLEYNEADLAVPNLAQVSRLVRESVASQPMRQLPLVARPANN